METDVLIAGGGIAGLACAMALRNTGLRVTLLEAGSTLGGRARSWTDESTGDAVDVGPHVITTHHANFLELLGECGTRDSIVWQRDPLITLFDGQRSIDAHLAALPAPLSLLPSMLAANHLSFAARLSNRKPTRQALGFLENDVTTLDRFDAATYLRNQGVHDAFIDWFWRSMSMTLLNVPLERCSAAALMRCYAQLCGHRAYCFGFPPAGLGELFVPGTLRALRAAAVEVRLDTRVLRIDRDAGGPLLRLADGNELRARHIVCALPPAEAAEILPSVAAVPRFEPSRYLSVYLWFEERITDACFWTRVWSPATVNFDFYDLGNIRPGRGTHGSLIASNIIHSQRLPAMEDDEVIALTLRELAEFAPAARSTRLIHSRVHHVPMAVPCPEPGTEMRRPANELEQTGLLLAGDWTRTGLPASMESAARSGRLAAEAILRRCGRPQRIALPPAPTTGFSGWVRRRRERRSAHA